MAQGKYELKDAYNMVVYRDRQIRSQDKSTVVDLRSIKSWRVISVGNGFEVRAYLTRAWFEVITKQETKELAVSVLDSILKFRCDDTLLYFPWEQFPSEYDEFDTKVSTTVDTEEVYGD